MNPPKKSFILWFSPRTGSTLLCKALEETGICGKAGEFLNDQGENTMQSYYNVEDFAALCQTLWQKGTSENGVFGAKYSCYLQHHLRVTDELLTMRMKQKSSVLDWHIFEDLFPNCKHIYLTRRNKARVATSWWKAIQDQQWHRLKRQEIPQKKEFYQDKYDVDALHHLFKEHCMREAYTEEILAYNNISPLTVVYEDFIRDFEGTIRRILDFMKIDQAKAKIKPPFYQKTADAHTEQWVQQFRSDMQASWDKKIW